MKEPQREGRKEPRKEASVYGREIGQEAVPLPIVIQNAILPYNRHYISLAAEMITKNGENNTGMRTYKIAVVYKKLHFFSRALPGDCTLFILLFWLKALPKGKELHSFTLFSSKQRPIEVLSLLSETIWRPCDNIFIVFIL